MPTPASTDRPLLTRRTLLAAGAAFVLPDLPSFGARHQARRWRPKDFPFALGVASGDPDASSVVLWTRLAPKPLEPDGGMPPEAVDVTWELAADDGFRNILATGKVRTGPELGHAVHVEVANLPADRWFWYRFRSGDVDSPIGRTRTLPAPDATPPQLRFAFASCQHYETGLYTAYEHMAAQDFDLVVHLGDYIYEGKGREGQVRKHQGGKLQTLADYRVRHAQYRSDPLLHGMHARCPWFVTWDDHEVENNYADAISQDPKVSPEQFLTQRAAAYQAYYEAMPLRRTSRPTGSRLQLYRRASYGRLAELFVLDTRQYRTDQPNGDGRKALDAAATATSNTLLGREQRRWLEAGLVANRARWHVLAQQVMMGMVGFPTKPDQDLRYSMDQWPGYAHERAELLRFLAQKQIANPIVLTGDIHSHWVNDLRVDDHDAKAPIVATEFVGTSISSGGNGAPAEAELLRLQARNPGLRWLDRRRGYVACTVTPEHWRSDYLVVDQVTRPGGAVTTAASFTVDAGRAGAKRA